MKRFLPYILILVVIFVGFFSLAPNAQAQGVEPGPNELKGTCKYIVHIPDVGNETRVVPGLVTRTVCAVTATNDSAIADPEWDEESGSGEAVSLQRGGSGERSRSENPLADILPGCSSLVAGNFEDCIVKIAYYPFYVLPAFLLGVIGNFFNVIIAIALGSKMYNQPFVSEAWVVVRDLSNIFFILILLYIAFQTILGLGGHGGGPKKMIAQVIIMALLINFSMFFTKVIIDSSNILALVFYNRINVQTKINNTDQTTSKRDYMPVIDPAKTGVQDKDISGGMVSAFNPIKMLDEEFFDKARKQTQSVSPSTLGLATYVGGSALAGSVIPIIGTGVGAAIGAGAYTIKSIVGYFIPSDKVPNSLILGLMVLSGLIMYFALYAFFMAGISFLSRLVELWVLMIFAPFAFMSSIVPKLSNIEGIGWEQWLKRLLSISFMAPIFMFFMYLIFKLVDSEIFSSLSDRSFNEQGTVEALVLIILPALAILILLKKATEFAKKGGGELGKMMLGAVKMAGGITGGVALGVGAAAGRASIGRVATNISEKQGFKDFAAKSKFGAGLLKTTRKVGEGSFDARGIPGAGKILGATGLAKGAGFIKKQEGGFTKSRKDYVEKEEKFASSLEMSEKERWERGLTYSGDEEADTFVKEQIDRINRERTLARAGKIEGRGGFRSNAIAATKIREAGRNKAKKIQDAILAVAGGAGAAPGGAGAAPGGAGAAPGGAGAAPHP